MKAGKLCGCDNTFMMGFALTSREVAFLQGAARSYISQGMCPACPLDRTLFSVKEFHREWPLAFPELILTSCAFPSGSDDNRRQSSHCLPRGQGAPLPPEGAHPRSAASCKQR